MAWLEAQQRLRGTISTIAFCSFPPTSPFKEEDGGRSPILDFFQKGVSLAAAPVGAEAESAHAIKAVTRASGKRLSAPSRSDAHGRTRCE